MTAPQPPDDRSSPQTAANPWVPPRSGERPPDRPGPAGPGRRVELAEGAAAMVLLAAAGGVLLGVVWWWLAPRVPLISNGEALFPVNSEGEESVAADGTFLFLALGVGLVAGVAAFLWRRRGGVLLVLALAAGALLAAVVAWRLGVWLDPTRTEVLQQAREDGAGATLDAPLRLNATMALLGLPFGAVGGHAFCLGLWGPRDDAPRSLPPLDASSGGAHAAPGSAG